MAREHVYDGAISDCWCKPYLYYVASNGNEVWIHRESVPPPAELLLELCEAAEAGIDRDPVETA